MTERVKIYEVEVIGVTELAGIVAGQQRAAAEHPDVEPEPTIVYLEIGPDDVYEQALALIDLGRPYGLVAGHRRHHEPQRNKEL